MAYNNLFISIGAVIIDDIILPDGRSKMGVLGGGAVHAAMGMRVWSQDVGLISMTGDNFPDSLQFYLNKYFDTRGLIVRSIPSPRAWMLFEKDGKRNEVFRTDYSQMVKNLCLPEEFPNEYEYLLGVHLHCNPFDIPRWVDCLRKRGSPILLWEPWDQFCLAKNFKYFCDFAKIVDIVSPNLEEGKLLTGFDHPLEVAQSILDCGAKVVSLRMGAKGSLVATFQQEPVIIPAVSVSPIIDVTGAGNSYCGGFIYGMHRTRDPIQAGYYGAVSASFSLEQFGALFPLNKIEERANNRLNKILSV